MSNQKTTSNAQLSTLEGQKVYIAGKVSGEPIAQCTMKFGTAQKQIEALGLQAVNPLEVVGDWNASWETAMKMCLKALMDCHAVVVLDDWRDSEGANLELVLAKRLGILIFYGIDDLRKYKI